MSIPYETLVKEDLNRGHGTVSVTMPGGGSATGNKIGIHSLLDSVVNGWDFGAQGDNVHDDTAALQAAITNQAAAGGGDVYLPDGLHVCTAALTISSDKVHIHGNGMSKTALMLRGATQSGIVVTAQQGVEITDLTISGAVTKTAGAAISLDYNVTDWNQFTRIKRVFFQSQYIGVDVLAAADWIVDTCIFKDPKVAGIKVQNTVNVDAGDGMIVNSVFLAPVSASYATSGFVFQKSGGGLRLLNNKFFGGTYHYLLDLTTNAQTGILMIAGNSFDGPQIGGVVFSSTSPGTGLYKLITITGNVFDNVQTAGQAALNFFASGAWLSDAEVVGNMFLVWPGTVGVSVTGSTGVNIDANHFLASGAACIGIDVTSGAAKTRVGANNTFRDTGTPFAPEIQNASATASVQPKTITGYTTWNPGGILTTANVQKDVTVTGAALGDIAYATLDTVLTSALILSAVVRATDTVRVTLYNPTGGTITPASGNVRATVFHHPVTVGL